ncbi:uncharacterized protein V1513DRAFT_452282 [Lipomyces chichibuensis]|uniref:uncharacterized protein n=1 Tax=Lipomyces chichibuensis TaxID=1546026 RepID=UPI003343F586
MSHIFRTIVWGGYFPIIMTLLYLFGTVSAYDRGRLCISAVYHLMDADPFGNGDWGTAVEECGLLVYQEGVDLNLKPISLLVTDVDGSAKVSTTFKVGLHICTVHGTWDSTLSDPPSAPSISKITCSGTNRVWPITSSDAGYRKSLSRPQSPNIMDAYELFGMYCGSY